MRGGKGAPILTAAAMRAAEEAAFAGGIAQDTLMERAGAAIAREATRFAVGQPILVLAGPGNNGGDGYVAARLLAESGHDVMVASLGNAKPGAAARMAALWRGPSVGLHTATARPVVVDGLFGTGLSRALDGDVCAAFRRLTTGAFVLAIDLPSGVGTDDGGDLGGVPADVTVALGALKPGHVLGASAGLSGYVIVADIGVAVASRWSLLARPRIEAPGRDAHKYSRGMVVVVAGAMPGAARLAARAALYGGAGYVVLATPTRAEGLPDAIVQQEIADPAALAMLLDDARIGAVMIGPGLGRGEHAAGLFDTALASPHDLIVDGDALSLLGTSAMRKLASRSAAAILTPHGGEFDRMFGARAGSKIDRTLAAAVATRVTVIHKGADTVIASPEGDVIVASGATPWLSTAGTGDVLAGLAAARHATGSPEAPAEALWLHARAAARAGPAFIADDLIAHIPGAIGECR